MKRTMIAALAIMLLPVFGWAHPGHGETGGYTIIHYFLEPEHALFAWSLVAIIAASVYIIYRVRKYQQK